MYPSKKPQNITYLNYKTLNITELFYHPIVNLKQKKQNCLTKFIPAIVKGC